MKRIITALLILALVLALGGCVGAAAGTIPPAEGNLTAEEARAIALDHAGFTAGQVKRLRTEYEIDEGIPRWEVQFRQGAWEYDYEIDARSGQILSYDRDD